MTAHSPSPFKKEIHPLKQAIAVIACMPVIMLLFLVPSWSGFYEVDPHFPWTVSASFTLLFAVANSVLSLGATDQNKYWGNSIFAYMGVVLIGGFIAWLISGQNIYEAKSFRWIYIVFTFGYLLFLSIVRLMRKIVQIAQEQDARLRGED